MRNLLRMLAGLLIALPTLSFAGTPQPIDFNPWQDVLMNIGFLFGIVFFTLSLLHIRYAKQNPSAYSYRTAMFLLLSASLFFSLPTFFCVATRSVAVDYPINLGDIAINGQLAKMDLHSKGGIYRIVPESTIKNTIGFIMLIGWFALFKALYHLGRAGYLGEKGHLQKAGSHFIASIFTINLTYFAPLLLSFFLTHFSINL